MCIIVLCIVLLGTIMASLINTYGTEQRISSLNYACSSLCDYFASDYLSSDYDHFRDYLYDGEDKFRPVIRLLSGNVGNSLVLITSADGEVMVSGAAGGVNLETLTPYSSDGTYVLPKSVMNTVVVNGSVSFTGDADGFFNEEVIITAETIRSRNAVFGAVFVCTPDNGVGPLYSAMIKAVAVAGLWIALAALVATYFVSERLVAPLREMGKAAAEYADGHFDFRIKVTGNDEVAELSRSFNSMADSLEELEDMRRSFFANISHELRTPMTTIVGFIDSIIDGAIPPEKTEYYLGVISDEVKRLSRLVTTMLDISRMQAGEKKFNKTTFDICEISRQVLISFEQRLDEKKLDVYFEADEDNIPVCADVDSIHQVIYNLCENGIKFSREGGRYGITIRRRDDAAVVEIYNEGVGIKEDELHYIFDRFYKSDKSRGLDKSGVGLGLYIVRTIIEAHGQTIKAESEYGEWCRFTFTLPLPEAEEDDKPKEAKGKR